MAPDYMTLQDSLALVARTDILLMHHGSAAPYLMFLPHSAVLIGSLHYEADPAKAGVAKDPFMDYIARQLANVTGIQHLR